MTDTWKHRKGDRYAAGRSYPQGNPDTGYWWSHWWDSSEVTTITAAKREGFKAAGSDDFNILAIRNGFVVAVLWMDEVIDTDPEVLAKWEDTRPDHTPTSRVRGGPYSASQCVPERLEN